MFLTGIPISVFGRGKYKFTKKRVSCIRQFYALGFSAAELRFTSWHLLEDASSELLILRFVSIHFNLREAVKKKSCIIYP